MKALVIIFVFAFVFLPSAAFAQKLKPAELAARFQPEKKAFLHFTPKSEPNLAFQTRLAMENKYGLKNTSEIIHPATFQIPVLNQIEESRVVGFLDQTDELRDIKFKTDLSTSHKFDTWNQFVYGFKKPFIWLKSKFH